MKRSIPFALFLTCSLLSYSKADNSMDVPIIGQRQSPWASYNLGFDTASSDTIGNLGCVITDMSMLLTYYGTPINPGEMNDWLKANSGFVSSDLMVWGTAARRGSGVSYGTAYNWQSVPADLNVINSEVDAGYPSFAEVRLSGKVHYVLITGRSGSTYYINDPWYADKTTLNSRYGDPARNIYSLHTYRGTHAVDTTPPSVTLTSGHPTGPADYTTGQRISWHIDDPSGIAGWGQAWDFDPGSSSFTTSDGYLDLPAGYHVLHVHVRDNSPNHNEKDYTFGPYNYFAAGYYPDGSLDQRILDAFNRNGGGGSVGTPVNHVHAWGADFVQDYDNNGILMANGGAAYWVHGAIWNYYVSIGGQASIVGRPITDETEAGINPNAAARGWTTKGRYNAFDTGDIYANQVGPHAGLVIEVPGNYRNKYSSMNGTGGELGFPTSGIQTADTSPQGSTGGRIWFEGGAMYDSPQAGTFATYGVLDTKYQALGSTYSALGFPTNDKSPADQGPFHTPGVVQRFEGGHMYEVPLPDGSTQAFASYGALESKYEALGGSSSYLGFPISDQYAFLGGLRQDYQGGSLTTGVSFTLAASPSPVNAGSKATGTVTLPAAAPSGGVTVLLSASDASVTVPASVTVAAGA